MDRAREVGQTPSRSWHPFSRLVSLTAWLWPIRHRIASDAALFNRTKDLEGDNASALAASTVSDPWYQKIVPNVRATSLIYASDFAHTMLVQEGAQESFTSWI